MSLVSNIHSVQVGDVYINPQGKMVGALDYFKSKTNLHEVKVGQVDGVDVQCMTKCKNLSKDSSYYFLHRAQRGVQMAKTTMRLRAKLEAKKNNGSE